MSADTTSVRYPLRLREAARAAGLDGEALCREVGLSIPARCPPELRVPTERVHRLLGLLAARTGDPAFALRLSARTELETFELLAFAAMTCPTLGEGLSCASRYLALFIDSALWVLHPPLDSEDALVRFELIRLSPPRPEDALADDLGAGDMVGFIRRALGRRWSPQEVRLRRPAPSDARIYREQFGVEVRFAEPRTELRFARRELSLPMQRADPALAAFFQRSAESRLAKSRARASLSAQVQHALASRLGGAMPSLDELARLLAMSPRTLRRKLSEESTSFRALLEEAQRGFAERHLAGGKLTLQEIAFLLGFSEVSAFARAFRRWTRTTPLAFRAAAGRRARSNL